MHDIAVLLTCEHAVNSVPEPWAALFEGREELLASHRGWDPGALEFAQFLAKKLDAPCFSARVSRLLVDNNRSLHNRFLWSDVTRVLSVEDKESLLEEHYKPFRQQTARWISSRLGEGQDVFHLSIHSFTPILNGEERNFDIGFLYDPRRSSEACFARFWKLRLVNLSPHLRIRFNSPYRGRSDGHTSTYRKIYTSRNYIGLELEINQALLTPQDSWRKMKKVVTDSLVETLRDICLDE